MFLWARAYRPGYRPGPVATSPKFFGIDHVRCLQGHFHNSETETELMSIAVSISLIMRATMMIDHGLRWASMGFDDDRYVGRSSQAYILERNSAMDDSIGGS